jgi:hypothetical protein
MNTRLFALLMLSTFAFAQKAKDTVTITTTPPGATVEWNRKVIGITPITYKVGEFAFNARKSSVFSKRLDQPVNLHITLDGFNAQDVTITGNPLLWGVLTDKAALRITSSNFRISTSGWTKCPSHRRHSRTVTSWKCGPLVSARR